jgi:hypothetical protein
MPYTHCHWYDTELNTVTDTCTDTDHRAVSDRRDRRVVCTTNLPRAVLSVSRRSLACAGVGPGDPTPEASRLSGNYKS